jgi:hypothetical protein
VTVLRARVEKQSQLLLELEASDSVNEGHLSALLKKNQEMKQRFKRLEKFKVRLPQPVPLLLQMDDIENVRAELANAVHEVRDVEVPRLRARIEAKTSKNHLKLAELRRMGADCDALAHGILVTKAAIAATFARLEDSGTELQAVNVEMQAELEGAVADRAEIDELRGELKREVDEWPQKIGKARAEIDDLPNHAQTRSIEKEKLVLKKRALIDQLEKKLDDVRQDLIARQAAMPIVQELTEQLEKEWVQHQKMLDAFQKREARLQALQLDLQRTEDAITEISTRWPVKGKIKRKKGLGERECLFEEALIQNRQMTMDHVLLRDEVAALEELHAGLKAGLQ